MYDIKWIRDNPEAFDRGLTRRGFQPFAKQLLVLDEKRRALITRLEQAQARRNAASKEIGQAKAKKDEATAQKLLAEMAELKTSIPAMEAEERQAVAMLDMELAQIPNTPADDVPDGAGPEGNVEYRAHGKKRDYAFKPKQHFELGEALGQMDFELAAKLSGARFVVLQKGLARLERALGQFMLDLHTGAHGYTEVSPPLMVRDAAMYGTAQLPKFVDDQFFAASTALIQELSVEMRPSLAGEALRQQMFANFFDASKLWLIPTAEVPLTNLVRESIVEEDTIAAASHRLHALLPRRSRRRRQGHPRHDPPAPVHQGRAGLHHHAGKIA